MRHGSSVGFVGLGRMGLALCRNLIDKGYRVVGYDHLEPCRTKLQRLGMASPASLKIICEELVPPRRIVLVVPAGEAVDAVISELLPHLGEGDIIADAGNSRYQDSVSRAGTLAGHGVGFLDVGLSGGTSGARSGACLTIGGSGESFKAMEPLLKDMAATGGCMHVGPSGWGHLVKTVHNGIEYGCMQAIAEGLHTIKAAADKEDVPLDLVRLCDAWCHGSIIESRLLRDTAEALGVVAEKHPSGRVGGGETGRWALQIAVGHDVAAPVLAAALEKREQSLAAPDFSSKVIAALRYVFGGHELH